MYRLLCLIPSMCLAVALAHCGSTSNSSQVGGAPTGTSADSQAAQQSMSAADDSSSIDTVGASRTSPAMLALELTHRLADVSATASFEVGGCTGQVAYTADVSGSTVNITATDIFSNDSCKGKLKLSGSQNIVITADASNSQRTALVSGTLTRTLDGGDEVMMSTLDPLVGYAYKLVATGTLASGDVNVMVSINENRVRS